jgi:membrane protease YdiL (CAAX protease family)
LLYQATGNLLVPMVAHALFDMGAMVHFRRIMAGSPQPS